MLQGKNTNHSRHRLGKVLRERFAGKFPAGGFPDLHGLIKSSIVNALCVVATLCFDWAPNERTFSVSAVTARVAHL